MVTMKEIYKEGSSFVLSRIAQIVCMVFIAVVAHLLWQSFGFNDVIAFVTLAAVLTACFLRLLMAPLNEAITRRPFLRSCLVHTRIIVCFSGFYVLIWLLLAISDKIIYQITTSFPESLVAIKDNLWLVMLAIVLCISFLIGRFFLALAYVMDNDSTLLSALRQIWMITRHKNILMTALGFYMFCFMLPSYVQDLSFVFTMFYYGILLPFSVFLYLKFSGKQPDVDDASVANLVVNPITRIVISALSIAWIIYWSYSATFYLWQKIFLSVVFGLIMFIIALVMFKLLPKRLRHKPSQPFNEYMDTVITSCKMQPEKIRTRYSYLNGAVAAALNNIIIIDPLTWNGLKNEEDAAKMLDLIKKKILPTMPPLRQELMIQIKNLLSVEVQAFILRHELGHVYYWHSTIRCLFLGIQYSFSIFMGLYSATLFTNNAYSEPYVAMLIGVLASIVIAVIINVIFGTRQEKAADLFAAQYSTKEEQEAFVQFIEQLEVVVVDCYRAMKRIRIPSQLLTGHPSSHKRAEYIRNFNKQ